MPELPEVEHVVRGLRRAVLGRRILAVELKLPRLLASPSPTTFKRKLRGSRIQAINRRGKYILFELDSGDVLLVHLRMTGKFLCIKQDEPLPPYPHVVFYLDDDRRLVFSDMRQFGRMRLLPANKLPALPQIEALAPEPLTEDFSHDYILDTLSKSRRSLKQLLLDQTKILGLGNIYASEALFLARISPQVIESTCPQTSSGDPRHTRRSDRCGLYLEDRSQRCGGKLHRNERKILASV